MKASSVARVVPTDLERRPRPPLPAPLPGAGVLASAPFQKRWGGGHLGAGETQGAGAKGAWGLELE